MEWWLDDKTGSYMWVYGEPGVRKGYRCVLFKHAGDGGRWYASNFDGSDDNFMGPFDTLEEAKVMALVRF